MDATGTARFPAPLGNRLQDLLQEPSGGGSPGIEDNTMPLRDHFHTTSTILNWEALHGFWPAAIVARLNSILPKEYIAQPRVHLGS